MKKLLGIIIACCFILASCSKTSNDPALNQKADSIKIKDSISKLAMPTTTPLCVGSTGATGATGTTSATLTTTVKRSKK